MTENLDIDYMWQTEVAELEGFRTDLWEIHEQVTAKQAFETHIKPIETQAKQSQETLAPYRANDE